MLRIVYSSIARAPFDSRAQGTLLARARHHNAGCGVTGILLFRDGRYLHWLEGEAAGIRQVFGAICRDSRHDNVVKLLETPLGAREFGSSTLAFHNVTDADLVRLADGRVSAHKPPVGMAAIAVNPPLALRLFHQLADPAALPGRRVVRPSARLSCVALPKRLRPWLQAAAHRS